MQIRFNKLKKETGVVSGALSAKPAPEASPAPFLVQQKFFVEKGIGPKNKPDQNKHKF